jgi:hypothetical protein
MNQGASSAQKGWIRCRQNPQVRGYKPGMGAGSSLYSIPSQIKYKKLSFVSNNLFLLKIQNKPEKKK